MRVIGRLEEPTVQRWLNTLLIMVCLLVMLACGGVTPTTVCCVGTPPDGHQHRLYRLTVSSASGTVMLSAEAKEERLRGQLEKGEFTMGEIRADYARYCK